MTPLFNVHRHNRNDDDGQDRGGIGEGAPSSSSSSSSSYMTGATMTPHFLTRPTITAKISGSGGGGGGGGDGGTSRMMNCAPLSSSSKYDDGYNRSKKGTDKEARGHASTSTTTPSSPSMTCSALTSKVANFLLLRRLLLSTFVVPISILIVPPLLCASFATCGRALLAAVGAGGGGVGGGDYSSLDLLSSVVVLLLARAVHRAGGDAIMRHAPNDIAKRDALSRSAVSLPFWSMLISIVAVRTIRGTSAHAVPSFLLASSAVRRWRYPDVANATMGALGLCIGPSLAWTTLGMLVALRYAGPFRPMVRCSAIPLRTNPFDFTLHRFGRNFTSRTRFLDMIADGLDMLSSPSSSSSSSSSSLPSSSVDGGTKSTTAPPLLSSSFLATTAKTADGGPKVIGNDASNDGTIATSKRGRRPDDLPSSLVRRIANSSTGNERYSRPGLSSVLVQVLVNAVGGHVLARGFVLPRVGGLIFFLPSSSSSSVNDEIIALSCLLVPIFELLFASVNESELNYLQHREYRLHLDDDDHRGRPRTRTLLVALMGDVVRRARRSMFGATMLVPPLMASVVVMLWRGSSSGPSAAFDSPPPLSYHWTSVVRSIFASYAIVAAMVIVITVQDSLTRWAACAPGVDADALLSRARETTSASSPSSSSSSSADDDDVDAFLTEDLIIQSVLMGDGITVDAVIAAPSTATTKSRTSAALPSGVNNHQDDEILRNEMAIASFSGWIERSSTAAPGRLSDDILRMCVLETLGGGGSVMSGSGPYYFGSSRHAAAVRRRLDLSAATASPGRQPIAVPVVRALCAFAGGVGDAMSLFYRSSDEDGRMLRREDDCSELWKLPPGSLHAAEFSIVAAARLVVMNSVVIDAHGCVAVNSSKRHDRLSLLLPCVIQSAYKLHCGIIQYAEATAASFGWDLSTHDKTGRKEDSLGCFIVAKCPDLCPVISACKDSAKMAMRTLAASGDRSFEDLLTRRKWKGDLQQWLVGL